MVERSPVATPRLARGALFDHARGGREVPYKLYIPQGAEVPVPLIIWSHGLGGSREGAGFLARYMCERGYALLHLTHRGTDTSIWEGKPGHPWDVIRNTKISREDTHNRFYDVPFALDCLDDILSEHEAGGLVDREKIGMSGHSFGAITTQIMAGQKIGKPDSRFQIKESRFRAGLAYSMGPTYNGNENPAEIYGPISLPMLYMTGTLDVAPLTGRDYTHRLDIYESASAPEQHLLVLEEGDHMVFVGSRGKLEDSPHRERHEEIIQRVSYAWWEAMLKEDREAYDWLTGTGLEAFLGGDAVYKNRNAR